MTWVNPHPQPPARRRPVLIPDADRDRGIHVVAGSGSGKSVLLGRGLALQDCLKGIPQVIFDPHGPLIDNFLFGLHCLPEEVGRPALEWVRDIDMSGRSSPIPAFPLLFELGGESRRDIADRFLTAIRKTDPHLQSASVQGYNATYKIGAPTGIILSSLGLQLDSAPDLLRSPETWTDQFDEAVRRYSEAQAAVDFFTGEYLPLKPGDRLALANTYLAKVTQFSLDPSMAAMFTTTPPSLDLAEVVKRRETVLLDFRGETNAEKRRFKTRWVYESLMAFIKHRGPGRHVPLGLVVDELSEFTNQASLEYDLFATDLDELVNVYARNYSVWLTLAHQEMFQVGQGTNKTLLTMGTQIIGVTADMDAAKALAEQFGDLDPHRVKRFERRWGSVPTTTPDGGHLSYPEVLETVPVDMPLDEQVYLVAKQLLALPPFTFLVKKRNCPTLVRLNARPLTKGGWANETAPLLNRLRLHLTKSKQPALPPPHSPPLSLDLASKSATFLAAAPQGLGILIGDDADSPVLSNPTLVSQPAHPDYTSLFGEPLGEHGLP